MFQLAALNRRARAALSTDGLSYRTMAELDVVADRAVLRLRQSRRALAASPLERIHVAFDERVRTDTVEYLDRPEQPEAKKLRQIRWLHRQNLLLRTYQRFLRVLVPHAQAAAAARTAEGASGPVRLLELASGSGDLTLALARLADEQGLALSITGSDIVPAYVRNADARAKREGVKATFRELNAFALEGALREGDVDVAFIVQSIHHFSPGQLARMVAQVGATGARRFVGIDARRGLGMLAALPALCALSLDPYFTHDALVSVRRAYAEAELELIASIAAPRARVSVTSDGPFLSIVTIEYPRP